MIKVGFIKQNSGAKQIYRGMDAYSIYLFSHLKKISNKEFSIQEFELGDLESTYCDLYHFPAFSLTRPTIPINFKYPYLVTLHDATRLEFPGQYPLGIKGRFRLQYQKIVLHRARLVITDSHSSVRQIQKFLLLPARKIRRIHLAAPDVFKPITSKTTLQKFHKKYHLPQKFVLTNGDIDWNKNLLGLTTVCNDLKIPLVIYGKSPQELLQYPEKFDFRHPELRHLPQLRSELSNPNVKLLGFVSDSDLVGLFNLATVYCQPSFAEGFGIPVLQAMACGTPVACSRTHSLPEIAGSSAVYFDPHLPQSVSDTISGLISDSRTRAKLSSAGIIQAAKFSWETTARQTLLVYQEALSL